MAPKHWDRSHLLTALLRRRIAYWSFIFLKTREPHQKSAVQRKLHHFHYKYFSADPIRPATPFSKCRLLLLPIYFPRSSPQGCSSAGSVQGCLLLGCPGTSGHIWRISIAWCVVSAPLMACRQEESPCESGNEAPQWTEKCFKEREKCNLLLFCHRRLSEEV